jgi:hypothetical protein
MTFGEVLAQFKQEESPENIVPLVDDDTLRAGVVAWKSVIIANNAKPGEDCPYKDASRQWNWLWSQVEFDVPHFGVVAGCRAQDASTLVTRLQGLRLIYPDGTIHEQASQYLHAIIAAKLKRAK